MILGLFVMPIFREVLSTEPRKGHELFFFLSRENAIFSRGNAILSRGNAIFSRGNAIFSRDHVPSR